MPLPKQQKNSSIFRPSFFYLVLIFIAVLGYFGFRYYENNRPVTDYSAVYLDNGDVYFGKIYNSEAKFVILKDVYYFKDSGFIKQNDVTDSTTGADGGLSLVKMGSEVHAPESDMTILQQHIVFIESLSKTSKVLEAILAHKSVI